MMRFCSAHFRASVSPAVPGRAVPRLQLAAAAALFSTGGAAVKATALGPWPVASFRSGIAVLALLVLVPAARRLPDLRTWLVGVAYAATMICFVLANKLTTAANTTFLQATAPIWILVLGPKLLGERPSRREVAMCGLMAVGLALLLVGHDAPTRHASDPVRGNMVAAFTGLTWACTLMGLRWLGSRPGSDAGSAASGAVAGNVLAFLVTLPFVMPVPETTGADWVSVAYLGVVQVGVAYALLTAGLRHVRAFEAGLLLLLEPVLNPLWAFLFQSELPNAWAATGGAVIVLSMLGRALERPTH